MALWDVRYASKNIHVDAPNWLVAVGHALEPLGLEAELVSRMLCNTIEDGTVLVRDTRSDTVIKVIPLENMLDDVSDFLQAEGYDITTELTEEFFGIDESTADLAQGAPLYQLAEALFKTGGDIANAPTPERAALVALDLLGRFVPTDASSVIYATPDDTDLVFLAARGPRADDVRGIHVPFGQGFAGFCFESGGSLIVHDVTQDARYLRSVDQRTGFETCAVLACAILDSTAGVHGCVQLINPIDRFEDWHLEASKAVALRLGDYFHKQLTD
jgi:hypothetical protein